MSCGAGRHEWRYFGDDPLYRMVLPTFLNPWYRCKRCGFATAPILQPEGWKP